MVADCSLEIEIEDRNKICTHNVNENVGICQQILDFTLFVNRT